MTLKYTLGGALFGLLFPILSWILDCYLFNNISISFSAIKFIHLKTPIHYIIDTAPLFLGIAFGYAGHKQDIILNERNELEKLILIRTHDLAEKNAQLSTNIKLLNTQKSKLKEAAFLNSHSVRKHLATLIGLIKLLDYGDNSIEEIAYIRKNILSSSDELDKAIQEISKQLHD